MPDATMSQPSPSSILTVTGLRRTFGGLVAVADCTFDVGSGITGVIGPNGSGKSTLVNLVAGMLAPHRGSIQFDGKDITRQPAHRRAQAGLIRTFQLSRQFQSLTVLENVMVAAPGPDDTLRGALWRRRSMRARDRATLASAIDVLGDVGLAAKSDEYAGNLSGGQMRLLELARAFMAQPRLILLDEPTAGVDPTLITQVKAQLSRLAASGVAVLLVEHNLAIVEELCERVVVVANGRVLAVGSMTDHRANSEVVNAYLGVGAA
jgi:neutral amino acid transport system ATP-binding protein